MLDDIDSRLYRLKDRSGTMASDIVEVKSNVHDMKNDTRLLPHTMDLIKMDGFDEVDLRRHMDEMGSRN